MDDTERVPGGYGSFGAFAPVGNGLLSYISSVTFSTTFLKPMRILQFRPMFVTFYLIVSVDCLATGVSAPEAPVPDLQPPGTIVSESWKDLKFGFREVARSRVNPPSIFEGIGHFSFVYFRDEELCQCHNSEIAISADGAYAVFTDVTNGKLKLFEASSRKRTDLSSTFIGYPDSASWNITKRQAVVKLKHGNRQSITIAY